MCGWKSDVVRDEAEHNQRKDWSDGYTAVIPLDDYLKLQAQCENMRDGAAQKYSELVDKYVRLTDKYLDVKDQAEKLAEALEEVNEFTSSICEDMQHYFDNKCVPTLGEVNQSAIADSLVRVAIGKYNKFKEESAK